MGVRSPLPGTGAISATSAKRPNPAPPASAESAFLSDEDDVLRSA
jgi:hypothetical protein